MLSAQRIAGEQQVASSAMSQKYVVNRDSAKQSVAVNEMGLSLVAWNWNCFRYCKNKLTVQDWRVQLSGYVKVQRALMLEPLCVSTNPVRYLAVY